MFSMYQKVKNLRNLQLIKHTLTAWTNPDGGGVGWGEKTAWTNPNGGGVGCGEKTGGPDIPSGKS